MKFNEASTFKMGIDISHMQLELSTSENTNKPLELNQQATQPAVLWNICLKMKSGRSMGSQVGETFRL